MNPCEEHEYQKGNEHMKGRLLVIVISDSY